MKFKSSLAAAIMVAVATSVAPMAQADTAALFLNAQGEPTLAPVIQEIGPAVVNIATIGFVKNGYGGSPFGGVLPQNPNGGDGQPAHAVGSGVIVDAENGYIITNHHVIADADEIMVTLTDRRQFPAVLIGSDAETDVAVLQIDADNLISTSKTQTLNNVQTNTTKTKNDRSTANFNFRRIDHSTNTSRYTAPDIANLIKGSIFPNFGKRNFRNNRMIGKR